MTEVKGEPVIPEIEEYCRQIVALKVDECSAPELLRHALRLEIMCESATLEIYTGSKFALAMLVLEAATHLMQGVLPNTTAFLVKLVGRDGIVDLLRPMVRDGWEVRECDCDDPECTNLEIATSSMFEFAGAMEAVAGKVVDSIIGAIIKMRQTPVPSVN